MTPRRSPLPVLMIAMVASCLVSGCTSTDHGADRATHDTKPPTTTSPPSTSTTTSTLPAGTPSTVPGAPPVKPRSPALAPAAAAQMSLSTGSASSGTTVEVTVSGCPPPAGGYLGFFADSQALGDPQTPSYRHTFVLTATSGGDATGTYLVGAADTPGFGLMEVPCGAATNAVAVLTITGS